MALDVDTVDHDGPDEPSGSSTRRRTAAFVGGPLLIGAAGGAFLLLPDDEPDSLRSDSVDTTTSSTTTTVAPTEVFSEAASSTRPAPTTTAPTTTTTTTTPTTTVPPTTVPPSTLPVEPVIDNPDEPIAPPPDPRGWEEEIRVGSIAIPDLGVEEPLFSGIRLTTLDKGPGHWPGTALPGEAGNLVVAAHRTSHGGPFRHIDQLEAGDVVVFTTEQGELEYEVTETMIVGPEALWIIDQTDDATATLFACHPPGSVAQRIVVKLALTA